MLGPLHNSTPQTFTGATDAIKGSASELTAAMVSVAQGLLDSGSEITQIKKSVAAVTDAIISADNADAIKVAAQIVEVGVNTVVQGQAKHEAAGGQAATLDPVTLTSNLATAIKTQSVTTTARNIDTSTQILEALQTTSAAVTLTNETPITLDDIWSGAPGVTVTATVTVAVTIQADAETTANTVTDTLIANAATTQETTDGLGSVSPNVSTTTTLGVTTQPPTTLVQATIAPTTTLVVDTLPVTTIPTTNIATTTITIETTTTLTIPTTTTTLRDGDLDPRIAVVTALASASSSYLKDVTGSTTDPANYCGTGSHYDLQNLTMVYNDNGTPGQGAKDDDTIKIYGKIVLVGSTTVFYDVEMVLKGISNPKFPGEFFYGGSTTKIALVLSMNYQLTLDSTTNNLVSSVASVTPTAQFILPAGAGRVLQFLILNEQQFILTSSNLKASSSSVPQATLDKLVSLQDQSYLTEVAFEAAFGALLDASELIDYRTAIIQVAVKPLPAYTWAILPTGTSVASSCPP